MSRTQRKQGVVKIKIFFWNSKEETRQGILVENTNVVVDGLRK